MKNRMIVILTIAAFLAIGMSGKRIVPITRAAPALVEEVETVPLYRLFNKTTGTHFFTVDPNRKLVAIAGGWTPEGTAAFVFNKQIPGTVPLFVLRIGLDFWMEGKGDYGNGDVFGYTIDPKERDTLLKTPPIPAEAGGWCCGKGTSIWTLDGTGVACYIAPKQLPGTVPLYRLYRPKLSSPKHHFAEYLDYDNFYTTNEKEMSHFITNLGFQFVRIEGYVQPKPSAITDNSKPTPIPNNTGGQPTVTPDTDLLQQGCLRKALGGYDCPTVRSYETCQAYQKRGAVKACSTTADLAKQKAMEQELFKFGCNRFLGRADWFTCKTQNAMNTCESYRAKGQVTKCVIGWK